MERLNRTGKCLCWLHYIPMTTKSPGTSTCWGLLYKTARANFDKLSHESRLKSHCCRQAFCFCWRLKISHWGSLSVVVLERWRNVYSVFMTLWCRLCDWSVIFSTRLPLGENFEGVKSVKSVKFNSLLLYWLKMGEVFIVSNAARMTYFGRIS